jgi:hypothetical protein
MRTTRDRTESRTAPAFAALSHFQTMSFFFKASNGGKTFMLVVVDCFSKFLWAFPLKNKEAATIRKKLSKLFYSEG